MRILSLAITLCALVVSISAIQEEDYFTVITNMQNGLNVTLNGTLHSIEFGPRSPCRYWKTHDAANTKNWKYYSIYSSGVSAYLRFFEYRAGAIAQPDTTPSLFRIENDEHASYLVSLETEATGQKLAWTAERNATNPRGNMIVALRPYTRSESQQFSLTEEYVNPGDC